jgi:hypothetical protein
MSLAPAQGAASAAAAAAAAAAVYLPLQSVNVEVCGALRAPCFSQNVGSTQGRVGH